MKFLMTFLNTIINQIFINVINYISNQCLFYYIHTLKIFISFEILQFNDVIILAFKCN